MKLDNRYQNQLCVIWYRQLIAQMKKFFAAKAKQSELHFLWQYLKQIVAQERNG